MATIFIDNLPYEVNQQNNLLEASIAAGLDLPYFCWHPALGCVGSCRQCAVQHFQDENDTQGRMVMACMTPLKEGARFSIKHPNCTDFRKQVIEWMMINHPHDCPVCDEGGECHLQDMTVMTGHNTRRFRFKKRTFNNQNLGPFINHEMNRCITCYRCVRFYKDVAGGKDLSAFANSGRVYFGRNEDGSLESEFSGNLAEVCPTGVFTDKVFHAHHTRKWDLETAPSVCQLCSVGCNISPGERLGVLRRIQNRYNHDINGYFICDKGRFGHEYVNSPQRIYEARINGQSCSIQSANDYVKELIKNSSKTIGIGSPRASLESNWVLRQLVGADNFYSPDTESINASIHKAVSGLIKQHDKIASLKDIREADSIVIIGEDLTNTAPMMALSIRQAHANFAGQKALTEQNISPWNDAAVRDYVREKTLPIVSICIQATKLDDISKTYIAHPLEITKLAKTAFENLSDSKNPVIIAGSSLGDPCLIENISHMFEALATKNPNAKIAFVLPEVNSMGLELLNPLPLSNLQKPVDVAIVLEADLEWRLGKDFSELSKNIKNLVVLDSLATKTAQKANALLPVLSFAESTGSVINQEGRIQRYFGVYKSKFEDVQSPWRMLMAFTRHTWQNNDEVCESLAKDLAWPQHIFKDLYDANFSVLGHKIPRQTSEYSGRTAINANITMHEPTPRHDPDSPLVYSMEGARTKIPLPLISSSWQPHYNSVQSSFKTSLLLRNQEHPKSTHVKILGHIKNFKNKPLTQTKMALFDMPRIQVMPLYHIFASEERTCFAPALLERIPAVNAHISSIDAKTLGLKTGDKINVENKTDKYNFTVVVEDKLSKGVLLLPYGLTDSSLFFNEAIIKVSTNEGLV